MQITITINTDNAAFEGYSLGPEVSRILAQLEDEAARGGLESRKILDSNGNSCGEVRVEGEE